MLTDVLDPAVTVPAGPLARARAGVDAVRLLATLRAEYRDAVGAEVDVLRGWPGWGPLAPVFADPPKSPSWAALREDLAGLLPDGDLDRAESSIYNAFYTPGWLAGAMWAILLDLGFDGGTVLEPGCGAGAFLAAAPAGTGRPVRMVGVERDPTTAAICAQLHPGARVVAAALQDTTLAEDSVDAVIGNVPFGNVPVFDPDAPYAARMALHNYFLWRAVQALRPGGVAVLLTSRYTLDSQSEQVRDVLSWRADLLGAIRLPGAALHEAGTDVVTDILVLRRRHGGEDPGERTWTTSVPNLKLAGGAAFNSWLAAHPDMILGEVDVDPARGRHGRAVTVTARPGDPPLPEAVAAAGQWIAREARHARRVWTEDLDPADEPLDVVLADAQGRKEGSFHLCDDGRMGQVAGGRLVAATVDDPELRALVVLRDAAVALVDTEADPHTADADLAPLRARAHHLYRRYVDTFGPLNRGNLGGFRADPDVALVLALEVFNDRDGTGQPAPILLRRVNQPPTRKTHADSPQEAIALCLDACGRLDPQVLAGLLGADPATVMDGLGDAVFHDPAARTWVTAEEYLSGNVRRKLAEANVAAQSASVYRRNVDALAAVIPPDLDPEQIRVDLGVPFVPAADVAAFLAEVLGGGDERVRQRARPQVTYLPAIAHWQIEANRSQRATPAATTEWGTDRIDAYRLAEMAANGQAPVVYDEIREGNSTRRVRNITDTMEAEAKQRALAARFASWVWEDHDRTVRVAAGYNQQFRAVRLRTFDGSHLSFPGMADGFVPYPHQPDMVWRSLCTPAGLCGHDVGAGKTATMFMLATTARRLGMARKPLIVVPNHLLEQVTREGKQLYPGARILMASSEDLSDAHARKLFAARAATGDWDAVVLTHNAFTRLAVHPRTEARYLAARVADYKRALREAKQVGDVGDRSEKMLAKMVDTMVARSKELLAAPRDAGVYFDHLGVDYILYDEAQALKSLALPVRTEGFSVRPSQRAIDFAMKVWALRQRGQRALCTLFTGTPVTNTMLETYVMLHYLCPGLLDDMGLGSPDAWARTFVRFETVVEVDPTGHGFRMHRRPRRFVNVPELRTMLASVADIRDAKRLGLKRPDANYQVVVVDGGEVIRAIGAWLSERADKVRGNGRARKGADNMLTVCGDGRKAALDPTLVAARVAEHLAKMQREGTADSAAASLARVAQLIERDRRQVPVKVAAMVAEIAKRYHATKNLRYDGDPAGVRGALQVVFLDQGTPKPGNAGTYGTLRKQLVAAGVPAQAIRFVHEAKNDANKAALFADCRAGRVAVLIGSTEKMGTGTNVQDRVVALHHGDAPWRPDWLRQRDGRALRPANHNQVVDIVRYVVEGSFDGFMWQALERKGYFIEQLLYGEGDEREVEDIGDGSLSYAEIKAAATGNPLLMEKAQIDATVAELEMLAAAHHRGQLRLKSQVATDTRYATEERADADLYDAIAAKAATWSGAALVDTYGKPIPDEDAGKHVATLFKDLLKSGYGRPTVRVGGVLVGFEVQHGWNNTLLPQARLFTGDDPYDKKHSVVLYLERSMSGRKILAEAAATIAGATERGQRLRNRAVEHDQSAAQAQAMIGRPFEQADRLAQAQARQRQIDALMREHASTPAPAAPADAQPAAPAPIDRAPTVVLPTPAAEQAHGKAPEPASEPATAPAAAREDETWDELLAKVAADKTARKATTPPPRRPDLGDEWSQLLDSITPTPTPEPAPAPRGLTWDELLDSAPRHC